jgi:isocitrate dehydrogenase
MSNQQPTIIYTLTDEAPLLATSAFLPIIRTFAGPAGVNVVTSDISVAGRILGEFPEFLTEAARAGQPGRTGQADADPDTNIIKLPNISASVASSSARSRNCRRRATRSPTSRRSKTEEKAIRRATKCLGSAVNPVLREGNSDRRAPPPSRTTPASTRTAWASGAWPRARVAHMKHGDFYHGEKSMTLDGAAKSAWS